MKQMEKERWDGYVPCVERQRGQKILYVKIAGNRVGESSISLREKNTKGEMQWRELFFLFIPKMGSWSKTVTHSLTHVKIVHGPLVTN